ncbi:TonB-dependent receptor (plasmid) [Fibrella sp. ES10-3-2-2]
MMTLSLLVCLTLLQPLPRPATTDTLRERALDEVVVTATRSERPMGALPLPVTVIGAKQIRQMGSLRLNDVLGEQTGLAIVTDHGQGIQVQGFGPDYTLILVDGEPLVGRTAGTLDLTRLAVGNIRQIEIVKGPSSSLYGSEALAGVINIITDGATAAWGGSASARYGANRTSDFSADVSRTFGRLRVYAFGNRYASAGYTLPNAQGQTESGNPTVAPFVNYTGSGRLSYGFSPRLTLSVSGRYFSERQDNAFTVSQKQAVSGLGTVRDYSLNPVLTHRLTDGLKLTYRYYRTGYSTQTDLRYTATDKSYDATFFRQRFDRPEVVIERILDPKNILTAGAGLIWESVEATRYTDRRQFQTRYGFAQYEWMPGRGTATNRLTVIAGGRYDSHSQYASQFSPKLSGRYELTPLLALRGSVGVGFKAPDFRQLYLNFDNAVAGYSVFGTQELAAGLARLQGQNQLAEVLLDPASLNSLRAESSVAYNLGVVLDFWRTEVGKKYDLPAQLSLNLFRNDISDLIETQVVARKTNGQNVFSYNNLSRVFTQGAEVDGSYRLRLASGGQLTLSAGYQYLIAKDKSVVAAIEAGTIFRRNPETLVSELVKPSQYGGLLNRSRNMANVKLFYEHPRTGWSASLRGIYRGLYGFADRDGNLILDNDSEYVQGYAVWNVSAAKTWKTLTLQAGIDNLTGYTDPQFIPTLAGRLWYASLRWNWTGNAK